MLASSQALRRLSSSLERGELHPSTNEVRESNVGKIGIRDGDVYLFIIIELPTSWHMTYNISYHFFLWPGFGWIWRSAWWAFVGTSCLWLEYGIFSNSIKISDPNIQYPARSHLFRSFPGCFWGSIIFNRSQSQRAQIPRTLSPSLGYFKSLIFVH